MKNIIHSAFAPAAIGPYSQAVVANGLIYTSGQLPINPETGAFPAGIAEQTKQSLQNIKAILAEAGVGMEDHRLPERYGELRCDERCIRNFLPRG